MYFNNQSLEVKDKEAKKLTQEVNTLRQQCNEMTQKHLQEIKNLEVKQKDNITNEIHTVEKKYTAEISQLQEVCKTLLIYVNDILLIFLVYSRVNN